MGRILSVIGIALLVIANITGIGDALYVWISGSTLPEALWSAFKLWILILALGSGLLIIGVTIEK